jgi:hypothetical protein
MTTGDVLRGKTTSVTYVCKYNNYSTLEQNDMEHTVWSLHRSMLFISYLLYFLIVRKSIRTVMKENDGIMITRKFHLVAAKKGSFDTIVIMDI